MKARFLPALDAVLNGVQHTDGTKTEGILDLKPPPAPKGRYVLAKAAKAAAAETPTYQESVFEVLKEHATRDEQNEPIITVSDAGSVSVVPQDAEALNKALEELGEEEIVLAGVRMLTHAELGDCPITARQERLLIEVGLLEDKEPS